MPKRIAEENIEFSTFFKRPVFVVPPNCDALLDLDAVLHLSPVLPQCYIVSASIGCLR